MSAISDYTVDKAGAIIEFIKMMLAGCDINRLITYSVRYQLYLYAKH